MVNKHIADPYMEEEMEVCYTIATLYKAIAE